MVSVAFNNNNSLRYKFYRIRSENYYKTNINITQYIISIFLVTISNYYEPKLCIQNQKRINIQFFLKKSKQIEYFIVLDYFIKSIFLQIYVFFIFFFTLILLSDQDNPFILSNQKSTMQPKRSSNPRYPSKQSQTTSLGSIGNSDFIFNKTSLLSSALEKLKTKKSSAPKRVNQQPIPLQRSQPTKKIKTNTEAVLSYTPLQKDFYNFFTINKITLKSVKMVPQPKMQVGSVLLSAICDRGIGGKYLVANLNRNKKAYIDYMDIPMFVHNQEAGVQACELYQQPGDFAIGTVVKSRTVGKVQMSLGAIQQVDETQLRIGQVLVGQIKSKQQMGCHLRVKGLKKKKAYLPRSQFTQQTYQLLSQNKQIIVVIKEIETHSYIVRVNLITNQQLTLNFKGVQEEEMSKLQLQHYVVPGTLLNTKIVKVLSNGLIVKFFKIFLGYIHADHLLRPLNSYKNDQKLLARIIFQCASPPTIYLSQRHADLKVYQPNRDLYESIGKPEQLRQIQNSYLNPETQFYLHPLNMHSQMANINKFWAKQNNYFEGYQIMTSRKIGARVGDIIKQVPFSNFKVFGQTQGRFRVMCLDVWNKVIKVTNDVMLLKAKNLLSDTQQIQQNSKYAGFVTNFNQNGVVVQFCNNIKGILSQRELKLNNIQFSQSDIGKGIQVYVVNVKKNYLGLTLTPPQLRKNKTQKDGKQQNKTGDNNQKDWAQSGIIQSIDPKSIHPIYIKLKSRLIKISIFDGIRPPSLQDLPLIQDLQGNFTVGQRIKVFHKKGKHYLYPPEQLRDAQLRFCRVTKVQNNSLRVQTNDNQFKTCHICDVTDIISPAPLRQYQIGQYTIGRVIDQQNITLRKSIVQKGVPTNMKTVLQNYGEQEKMGDYRARIQAVGPSALKVDFVAFGYLKALTQKGCFVSLNRHFDVRIDKSELSDHFLQRPELVFSPNKIVLLRLISSKQKAQGNVVQFQGSLRESIIKFGFPLNDQILQTGVGLTVHGTVSGYAKGKGLVKLKCSRFTGIIGLRSVQGSGQDQTLEKVLPIGKQLVCKIIEYSLQNQKRLIRLSTLKRDFKKYQRLETTFQNDARIQSLWQNFKQLSQVKPQEQIQVQEAGNVSEQAEYNRLKKLLNLKGMEVQDDAEDDQDNQQEQQEQQGEAMDEEVAQQGQEVMDQQDQDVQEDQQHENLQQAKIDTQKKHQAHRRAAQFQSLPHSKQFYQSLLLANPSPQSHLLYISSLIPTAAPQQIRTQFVKAINSLSSVKDKDNMWISWLNTQLILGDFPGTVQKAIAANVASNVYFRILEILTQQQNWQVAIAFARKMLKKFNREAKAYISFLTMISKYQQAGNTVSDDLSWRQVKRRAIQCLKSNQVLQLEEHYAITLFSIGQQQQGRNLFQQLIARHPRRVDLWSVYVDQQVRWGNPQKARGLLQRGLSVGLKRRGMVALLKKYYKMQQEQGNKDAAGKLLKRAQAMATAYEEVRQQGEEDEQDISD